MTLSFQPLPTHDVRALQRGGPDAYGNVPERTISDGFANPCRHCLQQIPKGAGMLILAHRPFTALQPYAETGPIFLCAAECAAYVPDDGFPGALASPEYLIKGYDARERIIYGTGQIVPTTSIIEHATNLLARPGVAQVHVRSARNNCYQARLVAP